MGKDPFDDLMASVSEAGAIIRGEREPARVTRYVDAGNELLINPNPREIRVKLNLSREEFARVIGVSARTVEGWEQGRRKPSGSALALLRVPARHPESVLDTMRALVR